MVRYSEMAPTGSYIGIIDAQRRYSLIGENISVEADFSGLECPKATTVLVFSLCLVVYVSRCRLSGTVTMSCLPACSHDGDELINSL